MRLWFVISLLLIAATWGTYAWTEEDVYVDGMTGRDMLFLLLVAVTVLDWLAFAGTALWRVL